MKVLYIIIAFTGIIMTLNKDLCWIGIVLMILGIISYAKAEED